MFSELSAAQIADVMKALRPQKVDKGTAITRRGELAHSTHLIVDGEVKRSGCVTSMSISVQAISSAKLLPCDDRGARRLLSRFKPRACWCSMRQIFTALWIASRK
ncbi:MAG: hypothetical protein KGL35_00320 [Bradyrhizobium sp.]|nr:hypothetical protein [Bradyrhizobium sp.]